ncbi:MAG: hypothetical protein IT381_25250 [Deltaproteobacteria bacterium]|nr:hypothetical protein [Deltaproteobacteria bacterium]
MASNITTPPSSTRVAELNQEIALGDASTTKDATLRDPKAAEQAARSARADAKQKPQGADAKIGADGKARAADVAKFSDLVVKGETKELLAALLQGAAITPDGKPTAEGSSEAGIRAFAALTAMLGPPKPNMAEGFATPEGVLEHFGVALDVETLQLFGAVVGAGGKSALVESPIFAALVEHADQDSAHRSGGPTARADLPALLKKYSALVEKFFTKMSELSPEQLLAKQPAHVVAALQLAMPKIAEALRASFRAIDAQRKQNPDADVVIPSDLVVQSEQAFLPVLQKMSAVDRDLAAVKQDPKKWQALQTALRQIREQGRVSGVAPEIERLAKDIAPHARLSDDSASGAGLRMETKDAKAALGATASAQAPLLSGGVDIAHGDIGMLIYWIMSQVADAATDELRDIMGEMQKSLEAKKAQRAMIQKMREQQTEIKAQIRAEFTELKGAGLLHKDTTLEDYEAWRPVEYADDGSAQLPPIDASDIPALLREGPPEVDVDPATADVSFEKCDPAYAKMMAERYGVSENDIQALYGYWSQNPQLTGAGGKHDTAAFEAFLQGEGKLKGKNYLGMKEPGTDLVRGAMFKDAGDPPNPVIVAQNQAKVDKLLADLTQNGANADTGAKKKAELDAQKAKADAEKETQDGSTIEVTYADGKKERLPLYPTPNEIKAIADDPAKLEAYMNALVGNNELLPSYVEFKGLWANFLKARFSRNGDDSEKYADEIENAFSAAGLTEPGGAALSYLMGAMREQIMKTLGAAMMSNDVEKLASLGLTGQSYPTVGGEVPGWMIVEGEGHFWDWDEVNAWKKIGAGGPYPGHKDWDLGPTRDELNDGVTSAYKSRPSPSTDEGQSEEATSGPPPPSWQTQLAQEWAENREKDKQAAAVKAAANANKQSETNDTLSGLGQQGNVEIDDNGMSADGRSWRMGSAESFKNEIQAAEENLDTMADMTDLVQTRLQMYMDRRQKAIETLSNVMKKMSETMQTLVANQK